MTGLRIRILRLLLAVLMALPLVLIVPVTRVAHAGPHDGLPPLTAELDRSTPRKTLEAFSDAARRGDWLRAAHAFDLRDLSRDAQGREGPTLAQRLQRVIDLTHPYDPTLVVDNVDANGQPSVVVGTVLVDDEPVPISLTRVRFDDGTQRWLVSRTTVAMIPALYKAYGPHGWEDQLPSVLRRVRIYGVEAWQWMGLALALVLSWIVGQIAGRLLTGLGRRIAKRTRTQWDDELVAAAGGPGRLLMAVIALRLAIEPLHLGAGVARIAQRVAFTLLVVGIGWFLVRAVDVFAEWVVSRLPDGPDQEGHNRGVRTQLAVLQRLSTIVVVVVGSAVVLIQFELVRSVGLSLLASAGVVGIVFGIAAQKSLAGVIAGVQLSITQPVRIGDIVITEGEYGTVEEINLTYVVVKIWDERRLVVPIARFLDQPFQNWTKVSSEIQGIVVLQAYYTLPVERLRDELARVCKDSKHWDGRTCTLKVVDVTDRCVSLRALVSAANADALWDLRCEVREKLMKFLREHEGGIYLVRLRSETVTKPA